MDEVDKRWKLFLEQDDAEEEQKEDETESVTSYQIYCDMDGVLVDLEKGIEDKLVSSDLPEDIIIKALLVLHSGDTWQDLASNSELTDAAQAIFDILNNENVEERLQFWTYLPIKSDAAELWKYITLDDHDPIILSAPWKLPNGELDKACIQGKKNWIARHSLNPKEIIITPEKQVHAGPNHILIDDMLRYLEPWAGGGGIAIKHTDAESTEKQLKAEIKRLKLKDLLKDKN